MFSTPGSPLDVVEHSSMTEPQDYGLSEEERQSLRSLSLIHCESKSTSRPGSPPHPSVRRSQLQMGRRRRCRRGPSPPLRTRLTVMSLLTSTLSCVDSWRTVSINVHPFSYPIRSTRQIQISIGNSLNVLHRKFNWRVSIRRWSTTIYKSTSLPDWYPDQVLIRTQRWNIYKFFWWLC